MAKGLQQTIINANPDVNDRADLIKSDFDNIIYQKGQPVIIETALMCPCKSPNSNQQSTCQNCGGTGWAFINPRETRVVLQHVDNVTKYSGWSEELRGTVSISCMAEEDLCNMDRITYLAGISRHQEVLFVKKVNNILFAYTAYKIKSIAYIAKFVATTQKYVRLVEGTDYTFEGDTIRFSQSVPQGTSVTIRYKHAPTFHIMEMKRDTMETFKVVGREINQHMPLSAYARRAHYSMDKQNLNNTRLLNNSYQEDCMGDDCGCTPIGAAGMWKNTVASIDFFAGQEGCPAIGDTSFNFDETAIVNLKGRTLLGFFQEGSYVGQIVRPGNLTYITFLPVSGNITFTNGNFASGTEYSMLFV